MIVVSTSVRDEGCDLWCSSRVERAIGEKKKYIRAGETGWLVHWTVNAQPCSASFEPELAMRAELTGLS